MNSKVYFIFEVKYLIIYLEMVYIIIVRYLGLFLGLLESMFVLVVVVVVVRSYMLRVSCVF